MSLPASAIYNAGPWVIGWELYLSLRRLFCDAISTYKPHQVGASLELVSMKPLMPKRRIELYVRRTAISRLLSSLIKPALLLVYSIFSELVNSQPIILERGLRE